MLERKKYVHPCFLLRLKIMLIGIYCFVILFSLIKGDLPFDWAVTTANLTTVFLLLLLMLALIVAFVANKVMGLIIYSIEISVVLFFVGYIYFDELNKNLMRAASGEHYIPGPEVEDVCFFSTILGFFLGLRVICAVRDKRCRIEGERK
jgi:hypothetical protein